MRYCTNCGKELEESGDFCIHCGSKIESEPGLTVNNPPRLQSQSQSQPQQFMGSNFIRICALIVMVCFFFPFYVVSCGGSPIIEVSGLDLAVGIDRDYDYDGAPHLFLILIFAAVIIAATFVSAMKPRQNIIAMIGAIVGLLILILLQISTGDVKKEGLGVEVRYGFIGCFLGYFAILAFSIYDKTINKQNNGDGGG